MKLSYKSAGNFSPCPEYNGRAVCVDVTPLEHQTTQYGERDVFKLVFEIDQKQENGSPFCVWSRPFTASLHEKANFRKFMKQLYGRDLNAQELTDFDTESLIGRPVYIVVTHSEGNNGETYANIAAITPHKEAHGEPLQSSGKFVRKKDREPREGQGSQASYRKAENPADPDTGEAAGREDWMTTEVHVGKHAGVQLGDLDAEAVEKLLTHWLPSFATLEKPKAADKRLAAALEQAKAALEGATTEEADY
jgi:hypothetical protein